MLHSVCIGCKEYKVELLKIVVFLEITCVNVTTLQLRREVRLRREYLYRKAQEDRLRTIEEKKQKLEGALDGRRRCSFLYFLF